jgi:hypothetical protein
MFFIVFTMFFSGGLIPTYLLVGQTLHLQNTLWALIIPGAVQTLNLIIMRTAFQAVPVALEEAARIDGANDWTILFRIYLPLSWPVIAVMILFYGVAHWNSFFSALVYIRERDLYPLQLVLREILISSNVQNMATDVSSGDVLAIGETIKYATIIVAYLIRAPHALHPGQHRREGPRRRRHGAPGRRPVRHRRARPARRHHPRARGRRDAPGQRRPSGLPAHRGPLGGPSPDHPRAARRRQRPAQRRDRRARDDRRAWRTVVEALPRQDPRASAPAAHLDRATCSSRA